MARKVVSVGPHFRAADLETADRDTALSARGITVRSLVLGSAFVMAIAWLTPYVEEYLNGTLIASNHLPVSALLALLVVALLMNLGLMLHRLPPVIRLVYLSGYVVSYWGFWLWYHYERSRLLVPDAEGLPVMSWLLAILGFVAGLAFFGAGSIPQKDPDDTAGRDALGGLSGACLAVMAILVAGAHSGNLGQVEVICGVVFLLICAAGVFMTTIGGPLDRPESLVVLAMTMVMAAIPNIGLMGYLIPVMTAPFFYHSPENGWAERLHQHIPDWLSLKDNPEAGYKPVAWLYDGLPDGQAIPWAAWVRPLFYWSIFTLLIYGIMFFLSAILRKQWSDKERLPFPLAQVPLAMTEDYKPGQALAPFFRDRLVWIGIAIPFLIHSYNSLHDFFSSVPQIPLRFTNIDGKYLTEPPWSAIRPIRIFIYPSVIGLTYLISLEVAFSLWLFYFVQKAMVLVGVQMGYGQSHWDFDGGPGWRSILVNQGFGAMMAMVILGAYMARNHLWEVTQKALGPLLPGNRAADIDDSVEPVGYAVAFWGFWVCLIGSGAWLYAAGMSLGIIAILLFIFVLTIIGLTRLVAEGGLFYVQSAHSTPKQMLEAAVGTAPLGGTNLTINGFIHGIYMFDLRSMVMPSILHSFKIAGEGGLKRRHMALAVAIALFLGLIISYVSFLDISYKVGGNRLSNWFYRQWPVAPFRDANTSIKRDMSKLTSSSRGIIAETRTLLEEKPWAVAEEEQGGINAALEELEAVLKDVETASALRSRLSSLKENLRVISQRSGLERLKAATRTLEKPEERTDRNLYALRRSAKFLSTVDYPVDGLSDHLTKIETTLREWEGLSLPLAVVLGSAAGGATDAGAGLPAFRAGLAGSVLLNERRTAGDEGSGFRSEDLLYTLEEDLKELADILAEIASLVPRRDNSPLVEEIRSLAAGEVDIETYARLKGKVDELVERWSIDRGVHVIGSEVNRALTKHEDAVGLAMLRGKALSALGAARSLYSNSAFVAARPVLADTPDGRRLIVSSGDGTVFGLNPESGETVFKRRTGDFALIEPPVVDIDRNGAPEILLAGRRGTLVLLDTVRGRLLWSKPLDETLTSAAGPVDWKNQKCIAVGAGSGRVIVASLKGGKRLEEFRAAEDLAVTALAVRGQTIYAGYPGGVAVFQSGEEAPAQRPLSLSRLEGRDWPNESPAALFAVSDQGFLVVTRSGLVMKFAGKGRPETVELDSPVQRAFLVDGKCLVIHRDGLSVVESEGLTLERRERLEDTELAASAAGADGAVIAAAKDGKILRWGPEGLKTVADSGMEPACPPQLIEGAEGPVVVIADVYGGLYAVDSKGNTDWRFNTPGRKAGKPYWYSGDWVRWFWTGVGGAVFWAFTLIRQRIMWWPHPIGYIFMMSQPSYHKLWFSIMIGWLLKFAILKYLGFKNYYRLRGFFIGIVVGEVMAGGLWVFIDFITGTQHGWPIHIN